MTKNTLIADIYIVSDTCDEGYFHCKGNKCIRDYHVCDKKVDCPHGEDEENCPNCKYL